MSADDPVAALVLCDVGIVDYSFIQGRRVGRAGATWAVPAWP